MAIVSVLAHIVRDFLVFVGAIAALFAVLVVVISRLPNDNPLKRILTLLSYRLGATLVASAVAVPVEPVPGLDVAYDIGVPLPLVIYWISFFRAAGQIMAKASPPPRAGR
ncbi:MAG: hypothetical protein ACLQUZ_10125 [Rhizomicrobium sp.]